MHVIFGMSLDGPVYPAPLHDRDAVVGECHCGPQGLLRLLETRLGLSGIWESVPYRVEMYRQRLLAANHAKCFYHRSLQSDSLAVAETLLNWRDTLLSGGWDFEADESAPPRLRDLAAVEHLPDDLAPPVPQGCAERVRAVLAALADARPEIARITLVESPILLPPPWNVLLDRLAEAGVAVEEPASPVGTAGGDLGILQKAILGKAIAQKKPLPLAGDGSLVILRSGSETEAADLLACWLARQPETGRVLILPTGDRTLSRVLSLNGAPALGTDCYSQQRPILQVLPLLIELLWTPVDPFRLMELLTLPKTPVPAWAARKLAAVVAEAPGIGGEGWKRAVDEMAACAASREGAEPEGNGKWLRDLIATWLESPRYPLAEGAPRDAVLALAKRIAHWAGSRSCDEEGNAGQFMALAAQAGHLSRVLEALPESRIAQPQLQKLVRLVQKGGDASGEAAQAGHQPWVASPEGLADPAKEIVWWGFTSDNAPSSPRSPWSRGEHDFLCRRGVHLPEVEQQVARMVDTFLKPLFFARERLVLVIPALDSGRDSNPHPLYDRLTATCGGDLHKVEVSAAEWLSGNCKLPALPTAPVQARSLPVPRRFWKLKQTTALDPRDAESYSSLNDFFRTPYRWVLKYKARIRPEAIQGIGNTKMLMGSLAHRLFEQVFLPGEDFRRWTRLKMEQLVDEKMTLLLAEEGAVFLLPGYEAERMSLLTRTRRAAWVMANHIRDNGWSVAGTEAEVQGTLGSQPLQGRVDLLLEREDGVQALVDLKWGGEKYHRAALAENRALQLALYAHMLKQKKRWPHVAYFILSEAVLLAPDHGSFKDARVVPLPDDESLASLVRQMEKTWSWRRAQLDRSLIEVPVEGTVPESAHPVCEGGFLTPEDLEQAIPADEYLALVGWVEGNHD